MSTPTAYGTSLGTVNGKTKETFVSTNSIVSNGSFTQTITCLWTDRNTNSPAVNSLYPTNQHYYLQQVEHVQLDAGLCEITLTWVTDFDILPPPTAVEQSSQQEVPIQEHPHFSDWLADWDATNNQFISTSTKYGISSYLKGTTTVTVTQYFYQQPLTKMADIGCTEMPLGTWPGSAQNWLIIASTRQQQNQNWTSQTTYLYSFKEWNSDIYKPAGSNS